MVTGAGGSIGSQLCRELYAFKPAKIILFDISEPSLYNVYQEFISLKSKDTMIVPVLGTASDYYLVDKVISENKVNIIFMQQLINTFL